MKYVSHLPHTDYNRFYVDTKSNAKHTFVITQWDPTKVITKQPAA